MQSFSEQVQIEYIWEIRSPRCFFKH